MSFESSRTHQEHADPLADTLFAGSALSGFTGAENYTPITVGSSVAEAEAHRFEATALPAETSEAPSSPLRPPVEEVTPSSVKMVEKTIPRYDDPSLRPLTGAIPLVEGYIPGEEGTVAAEVAGEYRLIDARLTNMAVTFNRNHSERTALGHDCFIFAHACASGDDLNGIGVNDKGDIIIRTSATLFADSTFAIAAQHPMVRNAPVGAVIVMSTAVIPAGQLDPSALFEGDMHVAVRASADRGEPLYYSKIGTSDPVVLTTLHEVAQFYKAQSLGVALRMTAHYNESAADGDGNG